MWEREQARNQTFLIARRAHQRFLDAKLQRTRELEETRRQFNNACARFQKQCPIQFQGMYLLMKFYEITYRFAFHYYRVIGLCIEADSKPFLFQVNSPR